MSQSKPNKILLLIALMLCGTAGLVFAQEGGGNPIIEGEDGYKPENQLEKLIPNIDLEGKFIIVKPGQSKDSVQIKPSNPGKSQINPIQSLEKEAEKSHSSFNLFYYMFQKFKLNDIIDQ